ncbi:MAG: hypothetical protein WCY96_07100 [Candidatus Cloacimonadaceae bacterium]
MDYMERYIITGLIVSREYIDRIRKFWDLSFIESPELRQIGAWCIEYYDKYSKAPDSFIEAIYLDKLRTGAIHGSEAQYIEEILTSLSDEYGRGEKFNVAYLYDQTVKYFKARRLEMHNAQVDALIKAGRVDEAEELAQSFNSGIQEEEIGLDLASDDALNRVERAFSDISQRVITYPGALGEMWNDQLVRGAFFTLLAPEKRGKTFMLLELAMRAIRQKFNVAFFEAGDMTEAQILKRICVYIARRSDREKYCRDHFQPVADCVLNQLDLCDRADRNCDHGIFNVSLKDFYRYRERYVDIDTFSAKFEEFPEYEPCESKSCDEKQGTVWIRKIKKTNPLTGKEAREELQKFFYRYKRRFRLAVYPAKILTVNEIKNVLDSWERRDRFIPDVIIVDYADLLTANISDYRHRQDHIWAALRGLSQERYALVITATQADAASYTKGRLSVSNFSEDKRKLAHVTAQYGLNQDPAGREKKLGIMRINEIVVREGEFSTDNEVLILQDLFIGRPFLGSFKLITKKP